MKKSLVALAALAAVGAASAQSSVTLYGKIDASVQSGSYTADTWDAANAGLTAGKSYNNGMLVSSGNLNGSRWGMKGSEDLGGGLKVNFQLEQGFAIDSGVDFNRQALVGISGGFGSVTVGRQYTPYDWFWDDAQGYNGASAPGVVFASGAHWDVARVNNSIQYWSPAMGGFSATIQFAPGEDSDVDAYTAAGYTGAGSYTGLNLSYAGGPLAVNLSYEKAVNSSSAGSLNPKSSAGGMGDNVSAWLLTGGYDFTVARVTAGYERATVTQTGLVGDAVDAGWTLGVSVPMGATTFAATYARETTKVTGVAGEDLSTGFGAEVKYSLSKRTNVYGSFLRAQTTLAGSDTSTMRVFSVGMQHNF